MFLHISELNTNRIEAIEDVRLMLYIQHYIVLKYLANSYLLLIFTVICCARRGFRGLACFKFWWKLGLLLSSEDLSYRGA